MIIEIDKLLNEESYQSVISRYIEVCEFFTDSNVERLGLAHKSLFDFISTNSSSGFINFSVKHYTNKNKYEKALALLGQAGDAIITVDKEDICVTIDFKNKYIRSRGKRPWPGKSGKIVVFSWTDNRYRLIEPLEVFKVTPLSTILRNFNGQTER